MGLLAARHPGRFRGILHGSDPQTTPNIAKDSFVAHGFHAAVAGAKDICAAGFAFGRHQPAFQGLSAEASLDKLHRLIVCSSSVCESPFRDDLRAPLLQGVP